MNIYDILICPVCGCRLEKQGGSLICSGSPHEQTATGLFTPIPGNKGKRHCFDIASSGYVNLMPPGRERNSRSGDDRDMLRARSAFLGGGYYDAFAECAADMIADYYKDIPTVGGDRLIITDAGCGEGYHTCRMTKLLHGSYGRSVLCIGFDASKYGAAASAKRARREGLRESEAEAFFIAGNIFALPLRDKSTDAMVSLFAPVTEPEAYRTLSDSGVLVVGGSGKRHLWELRELLYDEPREAEAGLKVPSGFCMEDERTVEYTAHIEGEQMIRNLFTMTPFYYRTSVDAQKRLKNIESLDVTVQVEFRLLKKKR